jgi:hypothetical protein
MQNASHDDKLSARRFGLEPKIRYVADNHHGRIVEMVQSSPHPSDNPPETDRTEELIASPVVLELAARRGDLDMDGIRYVIIRCGTQYLMPYQEDHLSIGVKLRNDPVETASAMMGRAEVTTIRKHDGDAGT